MTLSIAPAVKVVYTTILDGISYQNYISPSRSTPYTYTYNLSLCRRARGRGWCATEAKKNSQKNIYFSMKILRLRMTKSVILVIFSVHCGEKIWIIVNFY